MSFLMRTSAGLASGATLVLATLILLSSTAADARTDDDPALTAGRHSLPFERWASVSHPHSRVIASQTLCRPFAGPVCSGARVHPGDPLTPTGDTGETVTDAAGRPDGWSESVRFAHATSDGPPTHLARAIFRPPG